jgi:hypothetical protein
VLVNSLEPRVASNASDKNPLVAGDLAPSVTPSVAISSATLVRMPALAMGSASDCLRKVNCEPLLSLSKDCPATLIGLK